jgi:hypothetical protein
MQSKVSLVGITELDARDDLSVVLLRNTDTNNERYVVIVLSALR